MRFFYWVLLALAAALAVLPAWAAHGYALWGDLKYPAGFAHFDYVNPLAPRGGDLRLVSNSRASTFDKYNPFTIKGSAPSYLSDVMFDSLLVGSLPGAIIGSMLSTRSPDHILRPALAAVLMVSGLRLLTQ